MVVITIGRTPRTGVIAGVAAVALVAGAVTWALSDRPTFDAPTSVYDPVAAGERPPDGFYQLLPRDFIEPIYDPRFTSAAAAGWPDDADVIGLAHGDDAKAYPVSLLNSREMVVDTIDGIPVLVTWCPLCGTALVHRREVDGRPVVFGVHGALWRNAMTWWDHDTGTIWSQPLGEAILGPRRGTALDVLPSEFTTWGAWRRGHPDTLALDAAAEATNFDLAGLLIVADLGDEVRAYSVADLREVGVVNDVVAGVEVAAVSPPGEPDRWAVYARRVGDVVVELDLVDGILRDSVTGSTFDPLRGWGLTGPLADEVLARLPSFVSLPGGGPMREPVFHQFWPDGSIWRL